jgi:hypothetical protein
VSGRLQAYGEATSDLTTNTQENFRLSFGRLLQQLYGPQQIKEHENERTTRGQERQRNRICRGRVPSGRESRRESSLPRSIVSLFLNRNTKQAAVSVAASFPPVKDLVKVRTNYFGEMLERQILEGFQQIVLLGAGLDSRAVRKAAGRVIFFGHSLSVAL